MQSSFNTINNADDLIKRLTYIGDWIIYLLMAAAFIYIVWNVVMYMIRLREGDEKRKEASTHVIWGIIGLAIILSVWGLVNIILGTFRTDNNAPKDRFPTADFINSSQGSPAVQQGGPVIQGDSSSGYYKTPQQ